MKDSTTVRVPSKIVDMIHSLIEDGYYQSESEFVTSAIRHGLIFYADIRKIAISANDSSIGIYSKMALPKPINDKISGFEFLMDLEPRNGDNYLNEKPSEELIANYYRSFTKVFLLLFDYLGGEPKPIQFKFSSGLKERSRVLYKTAYGFSRKMDFVKVSIVCLLVKIFESESLYNEIDGYVTKINSLKDTLVNSMVSDLLGGMNIMDVLTKNFGGLMSGDFDNKGKDNEG